MASTIWLIVLVIIVLQFYVYFSGYRREFSDAVRLAETLARVVEDQTQRSLQSIFLVLDTTHAEMSSEGSSLDHDLLRARIRSVPEIRGLYLVGPSGHISDSTISRGDIGLYVGEEEYIRRLQNTDGPTFTIGKPIERRSLTGPNMPNLAFFPLAMRLPNRKGYLVAAVNISFFELQYRPLLNSNGAAISLISFDGTVLMDADGTWKPGRKIVDADPIFQNYLPSIEAATFLRPAILGKDAQIVSFRVTRSFPMVVATAFNKTRVWDGWVRAMLPTLLPTGVAIVLVLFALFHLIRQFGRILRQEQELRESRDAAQAASKAKSQFLAVMSHEIRTPMNAVLGMASALLEEPLPPDQRSSVQSIHDAGDALLGVLNDILDYSRLEAGEIGLEEAPFSPRSLMDGVLDIIRPLAVAKGLEVNFNIQSELPQALVGDVGRLRQVLINVASNAVKFTERGSVTIALASHDGEDGKVSLDWAVTDTGIGIAPDRIEKLFQEFVQADSTIHRRFGGSGLGLAICRRILDRMGGRISATSVPGQGTTIRFGVTLASAGGGITPAEEMDESTANLRARITALGCPFRLLMADDNQTNHIVVRKLLREFEIEITSVMDGKDAVAAAERGSYHAILMDMRMPELDGVNATRLIRSSGGLNSTTRVIAFTANVMREDVTNCMEAGMNSVVIKPVRKRDLVSALASAIGDLGAVSADTAVSDGGQADTMPAFDPGPLAELEADVGADGIEEIVVLFRGETEERLRRLRSLDIRADMDDIGREAHTLKGSAAMLGLMRLSKEAASLEAAAAAGRIENYETAVELLSDSYRAGIGDLPKRAAIAA